MGKHTGEHLAEPAPEDASPPAARIDQRALLLHAGGVTATLVAWGFLVWLAIDFGGQARTGRTVAWLLLALATIGATACLFVTLILGSKVLLLLRGEALPAKPRRAPKGVAGKRAAR